MLFAEWRRVVHCTCDAPPGSRVVSIDRRQILLRTVDVERLIDDDHSPRSIGELARRLDLSLYHEQIESVEGLAGRD